MKDMMNRRLIFQLPHTALSPCKGHEWEQAILNVDIWAGRSVNIECAFCQDCSSITMSDKAWRKTINEIKTIVDDRIQKERSHFSILCRTKRGIKKIHRSLFRIIDWFGPTRH